MEYIIPLAMFGVLIAFIVWRKSAIKKNATDIGNTIKGQADTVQKMREK